MKIRISAITLLILLLSSLSFAQENKLVQFHMALLKKGPKWDGNSDPAKNPTLKQHLAYFVSLLDSGRAIIGGPTPESTDLAGIYILRAQSAEEAKAWAEADPAVKGGLFTAEMHPWWAEDIFGKAATAPLKMETVFLGFLKRGPNRKEGDGQTLEVQELQKAHIANINRLAETKKLVVAGPFGGSGDLRGIFVFRVGSLKEVQDLAASDPMIKIDRLRLDLHPWEVPVSVIP
ncbi:MAG: YciI family protein [Acidobacteriota bacterium]